MPLHWFEHDGTRILVNDFRNMSEEEAMDQLDEEIRILEEEPEKVRMLVDVTGAPIMTRFLAKARSLAPRIEVRLVKQAILGITGVKAFLLSGFNLFSPGVPLKPFESETSAKAYLLK